MPNTQKAKGILALSQYGISVPAFAIAGNEQELRDGYKRLTLYEDVPIFARPAPLWAIPGFVESRRVSSVEDAILHFRAMREVQAESEMILMQEIPADFNVVWTPGLVGVGPGHDGATAGKKSISFPCMRVKLEDMPDSSPWKAAYLNSGITENPAKNLRHPHVEAVLQDTFNKTFSVLWTQIRGGAEVQHGGDYVPRKITVKEVKLASECDTKSIDSMVIFDQWAKDHANSPDIVIWNPTGNGGDHVSIQAWANGIAVVYDKEPHVGDVLEETTNIGPDVLGAVRYLLAGLKCEIKLKAKEVRPEEGEISAYNALQVLLTLLHGFSRHGRDARWIGLAAALMLRLGSAAALGEMRHRTRERHLSRSTVQMRVFGWDYNTVRGKLTRACDLFARPGWKGGFGGEPWLRCTTSIVNLDSAIITLIKKPTEENLKRVVGALNISVNLAHNNGWWMNKFDGEEALFNLAASGTPILPVRVAPYVYRLHAFIEKLGVDDILEMMASFSKARTLRALKRYQGSLMEHVAEKDPEKYPQLAKKVERDLKKELANLNVATAQTYKDADSCSIKYQIKTSLGLVYWSVVVSSDKIYWEIGIGQSEVELHKLKSTALAPCKKQPEKLAELFDELGPPQNESSYAGSSSYYYSPMKSDGIFEDKDGRLYLHQTWSSPYVAGSRVYSFFVPLTGGVFKNVVTKGEENTTSAEQDKQVKWGEGPGPSCKCPSCKLQYGNAPSVENDESDEEYAGWEPDCDEPF